MLNKMREFSNIFHYYACTIGEACEDIAGRSRATTTTVRYKVEHQMRNSNAYATHTSLPLYIWLQFVKSLRYSPMQAQQLCIHSWR